MKKGYLIAIMLGLAFQSLAQNNRLLSTGKVGVGTTDPKSLLHLSSVDGVDHIQITKSATSPNLDIISAYDGSDSGQTGSFAYGVRPEDDAWQIWERHTGAEWRNLFILKLNGNVGIGRFDPQYKLDVNGLIRASEIRVEVPSWPDYVFRKDYQLMPLQTLKQYINQHGHLPGIPTEAEVLQNGLKLGEINNSLMKKIEELTLYLLDHQELIKKQDQAIMVMRAEIEQMKRAVDKLE